MSLRFFEGLKYKYDFDPINIDFPDFGFLLNRSFLFLNEKERLKLSDRYDSKGVRYGDVKKELFEKVMEYFQPYREKRDRLASRPKEIYEILRYGSEKADSIASEVLDRVKSSVGMSNNK